MSKQDEIVQTIKVLRQEVEVLTSRLRTGGTGYLHTTIDTLNSRIDELIGEAITPYFDNPDNNLSPRKLAGKIFDEDVYDGYEQHTEAMEQARLREIQDKAAGRKPNKVRDAYLHSSRVKPMEGEDLDDVEHTKEYYDTERNRAPSIQTMTSDGLSNRSMKQTHGRAVQTTSEMMQEELEPLPINTFK